MKPLDQYPTPVVDAKHFHGLISADGARDLERKLAMARDALGDASEYIHDDLGVVAERLAKQCREVLAATAPAP